MGSFISLDFVQPRSVRGDFYFSLHSMTIYSTSLFVVNVCRMFAQMYVALHMFYGFCVRLYTVFCVNIRILRKFVYSFCARCAAFSYVYGLSLAQVVQLLRTYTYFCACLAASAYVYGFFVLYEQILRTDTYSDSLKVLVIQSWGFVDLLGVPMIRSWGFLFIESPDDPILRVLWLVENPCERSWWLDRLEDSSGGSDLQGFLSNDLHVIIGQSGVSSLQGSAEFFIRKYLRDSPSNITWTVSCIAIYNLVK